MNSPIENQIFCNDSEKGLAPNQDAAYLQQMVKLALAGQPAMYVVKKSNSRRRSSYSRALVEIKLGYVGGQQGDRHQGCIAVICYSL